MLFHPNMDSAAFCAYLSEGYQRDKEEIMAQGSKDYKKSRDTLMNFLSALRYKALSHQYLFVKAKGKEEYKKLDINGKTPLDFVRHEYCQIKLSNCGMQLVSLLPYLGQSRFFLQVPDIDNILSPIPITPKYSFESVEANKKSRCF